MIFNRNRTRASVALAFLCAGVAAFVYSSWGGPAQTARAAQTVQSQPVAYTLFESGQVRPLALSPDGSRLFAVNTPDGQLELFDIGADGSLTHAASVPVGLEPVAVAARDDSEVWVVNHVSDSVSVVSVRAGETPRVVRTLLVGDEPRDIVFAGPQKRRAFITTAHRGQNSPVDPQLTTPGVGRADVWVFDSANLGDSLGGHPLTIITLFSDTPRALAATPDGSRVYAAAHASGNRTTTVHDAFVPDGAGEHTGDQIRGFGYTHSGGFPSPFLFISELGFVFDDVIFPNPGGFTRDEAGIKERRQVEAFLFAFDSNMAPAVGQQVTLRPDNVEVAGPRISLLIERAQAGECELVARGRVQDGVGGYLLSGGLFQPDRAGQPSLSDAGLRWLVLFSGRELTYTCVPPGSGARMGLDRDSDGVLNGDE